MATNDAIADNLMIDDPIVQEVRNIRLDIERQCGPDPDAYYRYLLSIQNGMKDRLVRGEPKWLVRDTKKFGAKEGAAPFIGGHVSSV